MRALTATKPQDARVVRTMLFSFQDLARLAQRARALLFDKISTELVVLALRGTDAEFREPVLSAMASRSRRLVEGELAQPATPPAIEIDKARKQIVKTVLAMAQRGEIDAQVKASLLMSLKRGAGASSWRGSFRCSGG